MSAAEQVFGIPELLELILLRLLDNLDYLDAQGDARPQNTWQRAQQLTTTLVASRVNRNFNDVFRTSINLRRRLFLTPDLVSNRSWDSKVESELPDILQVFYVCVIEGSLPLMNPMIQVELSNFPFRFWNLPYKTRGNQHCAFMIVSKDNLIQFRRRHLQEGSRTVVSRMLLSQPPCKSLQCDIFEDRDETREYVGRTTDLQDSLIFSEAGLTIGFVCDWLSVMFNAHADVARVKLTTI
ncbi:hypothetical protein AMS68_001047 [Peltaster fructicola]|uniref:Uncharacterized protein n=1 Tax=Peltaster fructicola TaxID=286661 RepID=A0A6H0XM01_9PEZI|nr:hypothetical protein AMS68_001047 [Peltaster fructicola]